MAPNGTKSKRAQIAQSAPAKPSAYEKIAGQFIEMLKAGTVPWHKPWVSSGWARNIESKKEYRGINRVYLSLMTQADGGSTWWGTFNQIQNAGGMVKKGEHGSPVIFYKLVEAKEDGQPVIQANGKPKMIPLMRAATVFNLTQTTIDPAEYPEPQAGPGEIAQEPIDLFTAYTEREGITFEEGGDQAFYSPRRDLIKLPFRQNFTTAAGYLNTLFHEATHSTGHMNRLARLTEAAAFGSEVYSKEELVAEMGAAFACHRFGLLEEERENSAAYIASWLRVLQDDPKMIIQASSAAEKAYSLICGEN